MRICSLLPSATEILYALGLGDDVVGVSHECDYPPDALRKPKVIRTLIDQDTRSSEEIDQEVHRSLERRESLYQVDAEALRRLHPDLIVTQELCDVCAIDATQVSAALRALSYQPDVISLHPHTLQEMLEDIRLVGERVGHQAQAEELVASYRRRIDQVQTRLAGISRRPRVFCLEWLAPPMATGHWVPEMVELAGGIEVLGRAGQPSRYANAEEIVDARPEVLILMPCGFSIERTRRELAVVSAQPWWGRIPAVRDGQVHLVNGPAYFNRAGPRLIDGIELLASVLHPDRCAGLLPAGAHAVAGL